MKTYRNLSDDLTRVWALLPARVGNTRDDVSMLVTPRRGADRAALLDQLRRVEVDLRNVRSRATTADDLFNAYLQWIANAVRALRYQIRETELEKLLLTRRYWTVQALVGGPVALARDLIDVELDDRLSVFEDTIKMTESAFRRWDGYNTIVVADTSFYHQHSQKLDDLDLSGLIDSGHRQIHLIVPMVVIDELEKQKRSSDKRIRGRAQITLAVIERVAGHAGVGQLRGGESSQLGPGGPPTGRVLIDVLFDLPGHVRLPITDDEIVDRALSVQILSGKEITFLTYDTNQAMRARHALLGKVQHLRRDVGDENT
ncbi:MAG: PIN domain-containing protein [Nocardioides sp.]